MRVPRGELFNDGLLFLERPGIVGHPDRILQGTCNFFNQPETIVKLTGRLCYHGGFFLKIIYCGEIMLMISLLCPDW